MEIIVNPLETTQWDEEQAEGRTTRLKTNDFNNPNCVEVEKAIF